MDLNNFLQYYHYKQENFNFLDKNSIYQLEIGFLNDKDKILKNVKKPNNCYNCWAFYFINFQCYNFPN